MFARATKSPDAFSGVLLKARYITKECQGEGLVKLRKGSGDLIGAKKFGLI
jgi:hypothetical protein